MSKISLTVIVPTKNEEKNLATCLMPLVGWASKIIVVDSLSTDLTKAIAMEHGVEVINFNYKGGWPKKRQHVLDTYDFKTDWILLLDCDEILTEMVKNEIAAACNQKNFDGYYLYLEMFFLGKMLKYACPPVRKLSLFRTGLGKFEKRYEEQNQSMGDMEVHEHVLVNGKVGELKNPVMHINFNSLSRFIIKHNEYSNYECKVINYGTADELRPNLFGSREQRRRYFKLKLVRNSLSPVLYFFYLYIFKLGFLDRKPGFLYIIYQCIYIYFINSKIYEDDLKNESY